MWNFLLKVALDSSLKGTADSIVNIIVPLKPKSDNIYNISTKISDLGFKIFNDNLELVLFNFSNALSEFLLDDEIFVVKFLIRKLSVTLLEVFLLCFILSMSSKLLFLKIKSLLLVILIFLFSY